MTTSQTKKENYALNNAIGHIESMVENFEEISDLNSLNPNDQPEEVKNPEEILKEIEVLEKESATLLSEIRKLIK